MFSTMLFTHLLQGSVPRSVLFDTDVEVEFVSDYEQPTAESQVSCSDKAQSTAASQI
jgi:hypothetical protein